MNTNTLFQHLTDKLPLSENAQLLHGVIDQLTSALIGRLIAERLIDYAGQPGETIEHAARTIADTLVAELPNIDIVPMCRLHNISPSTKW